MKYKRFKALKERFIDEGYHPVIAHKIAYEIVYGD